MLSYIVFSSLILSLQANFLQEVGQFFQPADISDKAVARLGLELFNAQWKEHGQKIAEDFPVANVLTKFTDQIAAPLQFASYVVCPQCQSYVREVQESLKTNEDLPRWLVEVLVPLTVCPAFYGVDPEIVPICLVAGFGGTLFLTHSDPYAVCQLLPFCSSGHKRSVEDGEDEHEHERHFTQSPYHNANHTASEVDGSSLQHKEIVKRVTDVINNMFKDNEHLLSRTRRDVLDRIEEF